MQAPQQLAFGPFLLDLRDEWLCRGTERIPLPPKTLAVLGALVTQAGHLVTKDALFASVWPATAVSDAVLTVAIRQLRRVLEDQARHPRFIETIHGRGYRFIAPVRALGVCAGPAGPGMPPAAARTYGRRPQYFVGRDAELAQLGQRWTAAQQGARQLVVIAGEAGIGKTALVAAFVAQAATAGACWVGYGQCIEPYGPGEPYLPILEALGRLGQEVDGPHLVSVLRQYAPSWLVHMPALVPATEREALQRMVGQPAQTRMLRELTEALDALTAQYPLVLVLEDLHWSDRATLTWLSYVARRPDPARLLILGTYRPVDAIVQAHPLRTVLSELQQHGQCVELALDYLSVDDVAAYLQQRFRAPGLATDLACVLHQRTHGNPLFLLAVMDELLRQQVVREEPGGWRIRGEVETILMVVPATLRALLEHQLAQCHREDQTLLDVASVAGVEFASASVAACLECPEDAIEAQCAALAHHGQFLEARGHAEWPDGTVTACFGFRHVLYQDILYQRIPAGRQARWHARIGGRLAQGFKGLAGDMAAVVAMHCIRGHLLSQAVPFLWQAGQQAVQRGAPHEALSFYEQALEALQRLPTTSDRLAYAIDLHLALDETLFALGAFDRVYDTLQAAEQLAERLEDPCRLGWVNEALSTSFRRLGTYDQAVATAERARSLATTSGDAALLAWATCRLGQVAYFLGDYARAITYFREVIASPPAPTQDVGTLMVLPAHARSWLVYCLTQRGAFDEAVVLGAEAVRIAETGAFPTSQCAAYASLADVLLVRGAFPSAIALLERGLETCRRWHNRDWFPEYAASLGLAYAQVGRLAEALPLLEQAVVQETTMGGGHSAVGLTALSYGYLLAGRLAAARTQADLALNLACERQERGFQAWALRLLGEIAACNDPPKTESARASYQHALALAEALGMRPLQAHCHDGLGTLYRQIGHAGQACASLSTAIAMYREMAMTFWLARTEAALADIGGNQWQASHRAVAADNRE